MKKIAAILLVTIHLFNFTGVRLMLEYMLYQTNVKFEKQLDSGAYDKANLIEIKIPLSNPYYSSSLNYERYYGEFNHDGEYYNYVMRKVINDTVYLLCIPNSAKSGLSKTKHNLVGNAGDVTHSSPVKKGMEPGFKKQVFSPEYFQQNNRQGLVLHAMADTKQYFQLNIEGIISCYIEPPVKPPNDSKMLSYCIRA